MSGGVKSWIEKLSSTCADERQCACETIAGLSDQFNSTNTLSLLKDVMSALTPLIVDSCLAVRISAVGALRNLCADNEDEARHLIVLDPKVMTSLIQQLTLAVSVEDDGNPVNQNSIQLETLFLMTDLCGNCEEAVQSFNQNAGIKILLPLLACKHGDGQLQLAAAELLHVLSEENSPLAEFISTSENLSFLLSIVLSKESSYQELYVKVIICSVLCNVLQTNERSSALEIVDPLAELLCHGIDADLNSAVKELTVTTDNSQKHELRAKTEEAKYLLKSSQVALETIANIFTSHDSEWEDVESSDEMSSNENCRVVDMDEAMDSDMDCDRSDSAFSMALQTSLTLRGVVAKVFSSLNENDLEVVDLLKSGVCGEMLVSCIGKKLQAILGCLGNLLLQFEVDQLGGAEILHNLFNWLICLAKKFEKDNIILCDITNDLNSTVRKLTSVNYPELVEICRGDLPALYHLSRECEKDSAVQVNLLQTIGALGIALAKLVPTAPELLSIAEFLFHIAKEAEELWVSAEALDAIFDVFAEDDTDPVLREFQMVEKLQGLQPVFSQKYREKKKTFNGEQRLVINTVWSNFSRFISYKSSRLSKGN